LQPGLSIALADLSLIHGDCWVHLAIGARGHHETIARVFAIGPKACIDNGHDLGIKEARIVDMHASPDGRVLAVTVSVTTRSMDFSESFLTTVIVAAPPS
jgi:hypothetical protein